MRSRSLLLTLCLAVLASPLSAVVTPTGNQLWHLDTPLVQETAQAVDNLGSALAEGDFDHDGYADLAIGIPGRDFLFGVDNIGAVLVLYGSPDGLGTAGQQILTQGSGQVEDGDLFGWALASGDFDGDGFDDLAVGAPDEDLPGPAGDLVNAGNVTVFYGSATGLGTSEAWDQDVAGVPGAAETGDLFGSSLASGDFDRDGRDDLAVGAYGDTVGGQSSAGLVILLFGSSSGLTASGSQRFRQGFNGLGDSAEVGDGFGFSLAAGDFDDNGYDDLVIGAPAEDHEALGAVNAGVIHVLYGGPGGLDPADSELVWQGSGVILGTPEDGDFFGWSLAVGRVDSDREDDLVVGAPGEFISALAEGQVHVLFGGIGGFPAAANLILNEETPGINSELADDGFGETVAAGDLDGNGLAEVIIGIPDQAIRRPGLPPLPDAGLVWVMYGTPTPAIGTLQKISHYDQGVAAIAGPAGTADRFGSALVVGDFDGGGGGELAVGIPGREVSGEAGAGAVVVLTSALFTDGFESGDLSAWSTAVP